MQTFRDLLLSVPIRKLAKRILNGDHRRWTRDILEWGPPPYDRAPNFIRRNIPFIPALALQGKAKGALFYTYELLEKEAWKVRLKLDWANRDIHAMFEMNQIPFHVDTSGIMMSWNDPEQFDRYLNSIPTRINDPKFLALLKTLGAQFSRDCVHMWFADYHSLDGLVTMDKTFIGKFNQYRQSTGYRSRAFSPEDICRSLKIDPVGADWFTARADSHIFYEKPRPIAIGEYLFDNKDAEKLFYSSDD